jgi:pimeloyl-ACP methyl ester carboxylesterase
MMTNRAKLCAAVVATAMALTGAPEDAAAANNATCKAANAWVAPHVVNYRTVLNDAEENGTEPDLTAFVELADGSAGDIDASSVTLNGAPALPGSTALGDANENGIADLMVKFNRSVLITTDGMVKMTGNTSTGECFAAETRVQIRCLPESVVRSDYFIDFTTSDMPAPALDGQPARLDVHRVTPVFPSNCQSISPIRAVVLVHGRTITGTAVFDLRYQDYSLMETLAMRGIDTFSADHLGFGLSSLADESSVPDPLAEPCNASLPQCRVQPGQACVPADGVCDCQDPPPAAPQRMNQQGDPRYLGSHPLNALCAHEGEGGHTRFQRVTNQVAQLSLVVDDARAKTGLEKVHLLGLSVGGHTVGKYLGDDVSHQDKVAGVVFLSSSGFAGIAGLPEQSVISWPLGLLDKTDVMENLNRRGPTCSRGDGCVAGCAVPDPDCAKGLISCPGQQDPIADLSIFDRAWAAMQGRDPVGPLWGPQPGGLSRYPLVSRFLWNSAVAGRIAIPALSIVGLKDSVVAPIRGVEVYNSLGSQRKALVQLDCASHIPLWESCSGKGCVTPRSRVQKLVADWMLSGTIFAERAYDSGSFETAVDGTLVKAAP